MNIQELSADGKYSIFEKLSGVDLIKLCNTNIHFRNICQKQRFNSIWQQKIKQDYDIYYEEKDAYREYLRLMYLYSVKMYVVDFIYPSDPDESYCRIFYTREKAIEHVISEALDLFNCKDFLAINKMLLELAENNISTMASADMLVKITETNLRKNRGSAISEFFELHDNYRSKIVQIITQITPNISQENLDIVISKIENDFNYNIENIKILAQLLGYEI